MNYIEDYYNAFDEEARLLSRHGQVEYLTTMRYAKDCLEDFIDPAVLEIGAGTGRYSVALAKEGYRVTAVELVEKNLEKLRAKLEGSERIKPMLGNALDLSFLPDAAFDVTLMLGPMYHLFTIPDKVTALSEAARVTKKGGYILVAYCMNEPTVIQYVFGKNKLKEVREADLLTCEWHCKSDPREVFDLVRTEDIDVFNAAVPAKRVKLIAADGPAHYLRDMIDGMDDETFAAWMDYHFATCERGDLIGGSNHVLDILRKTR